jgi:hypothetical protein
LSVLTLLLVFTACLLVFTGCSDEEPAPSTPTQPPPAAAPEPGRGLDRTNEQEMAELVRGAVRGRPVRCRTERLEPGAPSVYGCTAGGRRYRVEWQHYGTGAYEIAELPGRRVVARGTLSISQ